MDKISPTDGDAERLPPRKRNGALTRIAILDAAERIFARKGLHGARTQDIASAIGVTKAMIHYYFATKEKLYQAVFDRVFEEREEMDFVSLQRLPPRAALEAFTERLLLQMCRKPHLGPLFALENVQNEGAYYRRSGGKIYRVIGEIIERGVADGCFRPIDPRHAAINIMGACIHYFNVSSNVRILWPKQEPQDDSLTLEHARLVTAFVINALVDPDAPPADAPHLGRKSAATSHSG